jgi:hypothetical protein
MQDKTSIFEDIFTIIPDTSFFLQLPKITSFGAPMRDMPA